MRRNATCTLCWVQGMETPDALLTGECLSCRCALAWNFRAGELELGSPEVAIANTRRASMD